MSENTPVKAPKEMTLTLGLIGFLVPIGVMIVFILLGVTPEVASEDACKVEHDLSEETFHCIQNYLKKMLEEQEEG